MVYNLTRKLKAKILLATRFTWRRKGLWLRAFLCWIIGLIFILADREHDYDMRLQIRGEQEADRQILVINVPPEDWTSSMAENLLNLILREKPLTVGMSPYFNEDDPIESKLFNDRHVVWATQLDDRGRVQSSHSVKTRNSNSGLNELLLDRDGVVRRFDFKLRSSSHFAAQLARRATTKNENAWSYFPVSRQPVINYRGPKNTFTQIDVDDFFSHAYPPQLMRDKIILIDSDGVLFRTPVGEMSRTEIVANLVDNMKNDRWIKRPSFVVISFLLLAVVLLMAWLTSNYPQFLALFIVLVMNFFYTTLSLWIFDSFYFWTPVFSVLLVSFVTYVTFLSFQLTLKEYLNAQLENERQFLFDVEQLKNNFLSLISHDLKTPIAKIQAICDRLLAQYPQQDFTHDLTSLREVASELHRYIRTILQITKVESRDFRISKDACDINEIIEAVTANLEPLARTKKIQLTAALDPIFLIEVDQVLIHEVILNLIENAIKYTPEGGAVKVSSQEVDDQVIIMVEDTGPGIPSEEQARIFDKFFRGELGRSQPKGSGLGLYLVKYFVELHNGRIFLNSTPKGTKVGFSLPLNETSGQTIRENEYATHA